MRFLPALFLLLTPLAGCALNPGMDDARQSRAGVMTAWIMPDNSRYSAGDSYTVYTSHDAHVAVFEVVPGRGIGMVYPSDEWHDGYVSAGLRRVVDIMPTHRRGYMRGAAFYATGPRYIVLVASEMPLQVDPLRSDFALRRAMNFRTFTAFNPYASIDALVNMVVPPQDPAGWDVDVYAIWPEYSPRQAEFKLVRVMCPALGQVFTVPLRLLDGLPLRCGQQPEKTDDDDEKVVVVDSAGEDDWKRIPVPPGDGRKVAPATEDRSFGPALSVPALPRRPMVAVDDDDDDDVFGPPGFRLPQTRRTIDAPRNRRSFGPDWDRDRRNPFGPRVDRRIRTPRSSRGVARTSRTPTTRSTPARTTSRPTTASTSSGSGEKKKKKNKKKKN